MTRILLALATVAILIVSCVTTTVNQEWKSPEHRDYRVKSALVVGLPSNAPIGRRCSDELVSQLSKRGITASPAYDILPTATTKAEAVAKAKEMGRDSLLVCRFMERRSQLDVYPSGGQSMILMPDDFFWSGPEYVENRYDVFATSLYDTSTGKAVWTAISDTYAGRSEDKVMASYVKTMIKKMEEQGLVGR